METKQVFKITETGMYVRRDGKVVEVAGSHPWGYVVIDDDGDYLVSNGGRFSFTTAQCAEDIVAKA